MRSRTALLLLGALASTLASGCEDGSLRRLPPDPSGGGGADARSPGDADASISADALAADAGSLDSSLDAQPLLDASASDALSDAEPVDASPADAAPHVPDAGPLDAQATDAQAEDAQAEDAGSADAGQACSALRFDGLSANVEIPNSTSLNPSGALTIEVWVRAEAGVVNPPWYPNLISKRSTNTTYPAWGLGIWLDLAPYSVANSSWATGNVPLVFGRWAHVAAVYDGSELRFYVDGAPAGVHRATSMGPANAEPVILGTLTNNTQNFRGDLAGLRVSTVPRYGAPFTPANSWSPDAETILLLPMDEGAGGTARDRSAFGNHATLNGVTWIPDCPP
ncbi:MAG: hypothetical protein IT384_04005 [Deltaproteobacteria bacterium]|nr:hypothetical protein [Deltaproteobacteria bacterium]